MSVSDLQVHIEEGHTKYLKWLRFYVMDENLTEVLISTLRSAKTL